MNHYEVGGGEDIDLNSDGYLDEGTLIGCYRTGLTEWGSEGYRGQNGHQE